MSVIKEQQWVTYALSPQKLSLLGAGAPSSYALPISGNGAVKQWHLQSPTSKAAHGVTADINVVDAWGDYRGQGITVGIIDDGVEFTHPELTANYRQNLDHDYTDNDATPLPGTAEENHGTMVAGIIAANGKTSGVAPGAGLTLDRFDGSIEDIAAAFRHHAHTVDVSHSSWGYTEFFSDDFGSPHFLPAAQALNEAIATGRGGLGTVVVFAAGNGRQDGDNTNYHNFQNSPFTITVGSVGKDGGMAPFSTPGASLLVSAPGIDITTTDRTGAAGEAATDFVSVNGTSFSAPMVSGVAALMLDANARLGYRDVQEILAYTAKQTDVHNASWQTNATTNANGGGLHFSNDFGFGLVDALAAVRLAETWVGGKTIHTMTTADTTVNQPAAIPDDRPAGITQAVTVTQAVEIDQVEVRLDIRHSWVGDLKVTLISPNGTSSELVSRPGVAPGSGYSTGSGEDDLVFTVSSNAFWGESSQGQWRLNVSDNGKGDTGTLQSWALKVLGDKETPNDTYVYTNEYGSRTAPADAGQRVLSDMGGNDTLNASATTSANVISLQSGSVNSVAGNRLTINQGTQIENVYSGDGNDTITGNATNNILSGGRGNDTLSGGAGTDTYAFTKSPGRDTITDFMDGEKLDLSRLELGVTKNTFGTFLGSSVSTSGKNTVITLDVDDSITLLNVNKSIITFDDFIFV